MAISFTETPETVEDTQSDLAVNRKRDRDETQVALDTLVKAMVEVWETAGKPGPAEAPRKRFTVPTKDRSAFKAMIRRATTLHKVAPVWYKDVASGTNTTVKFTIGPAPVRETKADAGPAADAAITAAHREGTAPSAPAPAPQPQSEGRRLIGGRR